MHGQSRFARIVLVWLTTLAGCGGGGYTGGGSALPRSPTLTIQPAPTTPTGIVVPTGALTLLAGTASIGSTIAASSSDAIFTIDSAIQPMQLASGATLHMATVRISSSTPANALILARKLRSGIPYRHPIEPEVHVPDTVADTRASLELLALARGVTDTAHRLGDQRRPTQEFAPGDRNTFELQGGTIAGATAYPTPIPMPAVLVAQSAHANVWLATAVTNNPAIFAQEYPSGAADFATVARDFEADFRIETSAFGPAYTTGIVNFAECDSSGTPVTVESARPDTTGRTDPHINIVITDQLAGSGEGGYFYGLDMLDRAEANCVPGPHKPTVNGLPMLVISGDSYPPGNNGPSETYPANNEAYWLNGDMPQTLAHEFQHYLHFVNKYLQQHVDNPADTTAGTLDDAYIDEGCSVLAQDLVAATAAQRESPTFVRAFLLEPGDFSLTAFGGYQPGGASSASTPAGYGFERYTAGNYGFAYLFVRYLYDRFGPQALKAIYAETNFGQVRRPDTGPATAAAGGEPFDRLFREFITAVAVHSGGSTAELSADPAYRFDASVILRGSVQTYSRRLPPYNIRTFVQPGPLDPEVFTGSVPTGRASLISGAELSVPLIDGGALFITPQAPWPQGVTLSASGIFDGGSLGQGALPTPAPAAY